MPLPKNSDCRPCDHPGARPRRSWGTAGTPLVAFLSLLVLALCASSSPAAPGPFLPPGNRAPSSSLEDLAGTRHTFPASGTWSIVFFWSLFCHTCLEEIPHLVEETAHLASPTCTPFFVSLDTSRMRKGLQNFLDKRRLTATVLLEEVASSAYLTADRWGVRTTPSVFLVDPEGTVRYSREGPFDLQEILSIMRGTTGPSPSAVISSASLIISASSSPVLSASAIASPSLTTPVTPSASAPRGP